MKPVVVPAAPSPWPRRIGAAVCFGLPILYLAVVFFIQPPDRLVRPDGPNYRDDLPESLRDYLKDRHLNRGRLLYDDNDLTAIALRGLNAQQGRVPGRLDEPDWPDDPTPWFNGLTDTETPPQPRFFLEYPPLMLGWFRLGWFAGPGIDKVPAVVLDAQQHSIVYHDPETSDQATLWQRFRWATRVYALGNLACLLGLMAVLRLGYCRDGSLTGPAWLLLLPAALYFTFSRFDVMPAAFLGFALFALGRKWLVLSAVLLAVATLMKVFPGLVAPLIVVYLLRQSWRKALVWSAVCAGTTVALFLVPVIQYGWQGAIAPFLFQFRRAAEFPWTIYGFVDGHWHLIDNTHWHFVGNWLLPSWWAEVGGNARAGIVLVLLGLLCLPRLAGLGSVLRRGLIVLIVFVAVQVFFSPQWLLWFSPLVVPLGAPLLQRARWRRADVVLTGLLIACAAALDLVMYTSFPIAFDCTYTWNADQTDFDSPLRVPLCLARFGLLGAMVLLLLVMEFRALWPRPVAVPEALPV